MPLMVDGLMTNGEPVDGADLRAHSGVTCRLCHGIKSVSKDGNASYVWSRAPLDAGTLADMHARKTGALIRACVILGGYGTVRIGMKQPGVFQSLYAMSPCCMGAALQPNADAMAKAAAIKAEAARAAEAKAADARADATKASSARAEAGKAEAEKAERGEAAVIYP